VLDRDDLEPETRLAEHFAEQGIPTRSSTVSGYLGMMAEPQYTVVPREAIRTIVGWLDEVSEKKRDVHLGHGALSRLPLQRTAEWGIGGVRVSEELATIPAHPGNGLFGVLTVPTRGPDSASGTVVILVNSGSVHHVGPNRLYVELARGLAREGVASLRFDLRNLGDSRLGECPNENHPYPTTAVADIGAALEWLVGERGFSRCVVAGLCSGAHTAFHSGLDLDSMAIAGVICINPLAFQWREGMSLDTPDTHRTTRDAQYYGGAVRNWSKWKKLLSGQANLGYIVRFTMSRARDVLRLRLRNGAERVHLRAPGPLGRQLERYSASGRPLRFVFSTRDPGHAILMSEAGPSVSRLLRRGDIGIAFVEDADHTFSRDVWRRGASDAVLEAVRAMETPGARA
jgi:hypothetical protein